VPASGSGSVETDLPNPLGDYAMSCLGRERIFEHFSRSLGIPMAVIRLNYATELRYGVLVDLARKVWEGQTIDVSMGHVNVIWQTEANAMSIQAFDHAASPPLFLNVAGPEVLKVREVCEQYGRLMGREPQFTGSESPTALLNNGAKGHGLYGTPLVTAGEMIERIAEWVQRGGKSLGKPTHFEARDGKF
jgi:nucleoside-diphosphate-sugar epimerase